MTYSLQEEAHKIAQDALRSEASLRAELRYQLQRTKALQAGAVNKAKQQAKKSRSKKKVDDCPGVNSVSVSGKRIYPLDKYWDQRPRKRSPVKEEAVETKYNPWRSVLNETITAPGERVFNDLKFFWFTLIS